MVGRKGAVHKETGSISEGEDAASACECAYVSPCTPVRKAKAASRAVGRLGEWFSPTLLALRYLPWAGGAAGTRRYDRLGSGRKAV